MPRQLRNVCYLVQDPLPGGTLSCPRCENASVYLSLPYGEPMCDDCDWTASDGDE